MISCKHDRCDRPVTGPGDDLCWFHRAQKIFAEQRRDRINRFRVLALDDAGNDVDVTDADPTDQCEVWPI